MQRGRTVCRDVTSGLVIAVIVFAAPAALGWLLLAAFITPAGDAVIVLTNRWNRTTALAIHGATAAGLVAAAVLLLISR